MKYTPIAILIILIDPIFAASLLNHIAKGTATI